MNVGWIGRALPVYSATELPLEQHGASITSGCCFRRVTASAGSFPDSLISFLELDRDIFVCSTALPYHYPPPTPPRVSCVP
jgi:hypothetical protein